MWKTVMKQNVKYYFNVSIDYFHYQVSILITVSDKPHINVECKLIEEGGG